MNENVIPVLMGQALGTKNFKLFTRTSDVKDKVTWTPTTSKKFFDDIKSLAAALQEKGIGKNSVVGMIHDSSPRWIMFDLAVLFLGGITVPMFSNCSEAAVQHIMDNSEMGFCFIEHKYLCSPTSKVVHANCDETFSHLTELIDRGREILDVHPLTTLYAIKDINPDDTATIIYTSGSTGLPKGVVLSHKNLCTQIKSSNKCFPIKKGERALSFLPLAHVFERMVCYSHINAGADVYFLDDLDYLGESLKKVRPTIMTAVPRLLEKLRTKISTSMSEATGIKKVLIEAATGAKGRSIAKWIVDRSVRKNLGGKLKYLVCGGAALAVEDQQFFVDFGVPVYTGYGLTEAGPAVSANTKEHNRIGSVGKLFPNVHVTLDRKDPSDEEGEILVKSQGVTSGYYKMPEKTEKLFDGVWLRTGDKGKFDNDGYLYITGRIKELFKTANGKYVSPVYIEGKLNQLPCIDASMIVGEGKNCVTALIFSSITENKDIISEHIEDVNKQLNHWEEITNHVVIDCSPTPESGMLTPTMKLKREVVHSLYQDIIVQMYKENEARSSK